ncbi:jg25578 [Pararge aegeria aegeria]|uniref:Jg25578 protein n=1 Tax=Pararge aegeria aegeria TaxID=348720 RepID=A0A8S4QY31_9NEOP|nr:jg25578 [Pararge aegeria aegeria]
MERACARAVIAERCAGDSDFPQRTLAISSASAAPGRAVFTSKSFNSDPMSPSDTQSFGSVPFLLCGIASLAGPGFAGKLCFPGVVLLALALRPAFMTWACWFCSISSEPAATYPANFIYWLAWEVVNVSFRLCLRVLALLWEGMGVYHRGRTSCTYILTFRLREVLLSGLGVALIWLPAALGYSGLDVT